MTTLLWPLQVINLYNVPFQILTAKIITVKIYLLIAVLGLTADARILVNRARVECQSHKLTVEDPVTLEYITRYIATLKQVYEHKID